MGPGSCHRLPGAPPGLSLLAARRGVLSPRASRGAWRFAGKRQAGRLLWAQLGLGAQQEDREPHGTGRTPGTAGAGGSAAGPRAPRHGRDPAVRRAAGSILRPASPKGCWPGRAEAGSYGRGGVALSRGTQSWQAGAEPGSVPRRDARAGAGQGNPLQARLTAGAFQVALAAPSSRSELPAKEDAESCGILLLLPERRCNFTPGASIWRLA